MSGTIKFEAGIRVAMDAQVKRGRRIALVIAHLGPGGAQRVVATAANALAERGLDTHVVTVFDDHADAYTLDPRVRRHKRVWMETDRVQSSSSLSSDSLKSAARQSIRSLLSYNAIRRPLGLAAFGINLIARVLWLRSVLRKIKPDAVLSFLTQTNIIAILAAKAIAERIIVSERNDPRLQQPRRRVTLMRKLTYPWADLVTANTQAALAEMEEFVPRSRLAFLPNPLSFPDLSVCVNFAAPTFITVTRLVEQKGIDVLLKAAARAFESLPGWRLAILGDGPLRDEMKFLAAKLDISGQVDWLGYVEDPIAYLKAAQIFMLTSRFEGSPNALLEAMACGLPSIVSNASPGPVELVGEQAGLIVPVADVGATADAMVRLGRDEVLRARLAARARERTSMHELDNAMRVWLKLLYP